MNRQRLFWGDAAFLAGLVVFVTIHDPRSTVFAARLPSVFRDVVVADHELGVRVVSVGEASQASLADLRPEDLIVRVGDQSISSIEEFASLSESLRGQATEIEVVVFRNGLPRPLRLHLFSHPILDAWAIQVIPDHDIRFAEAERGLDYWSRLGQGFEIAGNAEKALESYLNGLHNVPTDTATAVKAAELFARVGQARLKADALESGIAALRDAVVMMERLFDEPLTEHQLWRIKRALEQTVTALRALRG